MYYTVHMTTHLDHVYMYNTYVHVHVHVHDKTETRGNVTYSDHTCTKRIQSCLWVRLEPRSFYRVLSRQLSARVQSACVCIYMLYTAKQRPYFNPTIYTHLSLSLYTLHMAPEEGVSRDDVHCPQSTLVSSQPHLELNLDTHSETHVHGIHDIVYGTLAHAKVEKQPRQATHIKT